MSLLPPLPSRLLPVVSLTNPSQSIKQTVQILWINSFTFPTVPALLRKSLGGTWILRQTPDRRLRLGPSVIPHMVICKGSVETICVSNFSFLQQFLPSPLFRQLTGT